MIIKGLDNPAKKLNLYDQINQYPPKSLIGILGSETNNGNFWSVTWWLEGLVVSYVGFWSWRITSKVEVEGDGPREQTDLPDRKLVDLLTRSMCLFTFHRPIWPSCLPWQEKKLRSHGWRSEALHELIERGRGAKQSRCGPIRLLACDGTGEYCCDECQVIFWKSTIVCIVTDLHTSLFHKEVRMRLTMLRMNVSFMEYMRKQYENLYSKLETIETRISSDLRNKVELLTGSRRHRNWFQIELTYNSILNDILTFFKEFNLTWCTHRFFIKLRLPPDFVSLPWLDVQVLEKIRIPQNVCSAPFTP